MTVGRGTWIALVVLVLALALLPLADQGYLLKLVTKILILGLFAMSLNLLVGGAGMVSLGHAAFYGVGAYTLWFVTPEYEAVSLWWSLPAAMLASGALAAVIGALSVRTKGVYFIMVTLAFAQMTYFVFHDGGFAGGSDGVYIYVKPEMSIGGVKLLNLERPADFFHLTLGLFALCAAAMAVLLQAPFGRALAGIRVNEHRMQALGHGVFAAKLAAFIIAGMMAGIAGYLSAAQFGFVNPELFGWHQSGQAMMMAILGGLNFLLGPALGAFTFVFLQEVLTDLTDHWLLPMGGFVILVALALPNGLAGVAADLWRRRRAPEPTAKPAEAPGDV